LRDVDGITELLFRDCGCCDFNNVLALAGTFFTMNVYDRVVLNQALVKLWTLAIGVCIALGFAFLARNLRAWLLDNAGKKADLVLGSVLFRQSLQIRLSQVQCAAKCNMHHKRRGCFTVRYART
jgi:ABC-type bacteriocin/lantibiotic exporter with double-glycine peptidase domain